MAVFTPKTSGLEKKKYLQSSIPDEIIVALLIHFVPKAHLSILHSPSSLPPKILAPHEGIFSYSRRNGCYRIYGLRYRLVRDGVYWTTADNNSGSLRHHECQALQMQRGNQKGYPKGLFLQSRHNKRLFQVRLSSRTNVDSYEQC